MLFLQILPIINEHVQYLWLEGFIYLHGKIGMKVNSLHSSAFSPYATYPILL